MTTSSVSNRWQMEDDRRFGQQQHPASLKQAARDFSTTSILPCRLEHVDCAERSTARVATWGSHLHHGNLFI